MSKPGETLYNVNLRHLSRDGRTAAADLPAQLLSHIPAKQLRGLLEAVGDLGPGVVYPVEPELRIAAPDGMFVVQLKGGRLNLVSWSSRHKGGEYSAEQIFAIVTGQELVGGAGRAVDTGGGGGGLRARATLIALALAIVGVNSFTVWFVTRPPRTLLPHYTLLPPGPGERLLGNVAGPYETGGKPGDRRLEIAPNGKAQRYKFGPERAPTAQQAFTVQPADTQGKPVLLTSRKALITIKDPVTVVLYGDTYKRVPH